MSQYDNADRLTNETWRNKGTGAQIYGFQYTYDVFTYDVASRLTGATSGRYAIALARSYTGNSPAEHAGRLTSETVTISGWSPGTYTTSYHYDAANRVTSLTYPSGDVVGRTYTARNLLASALFDNAPATTRQYDAGGRLTSTTLGNGLVETREYRSDALGRRIQKSVYRTTTTFIHDGAQVIDEFDAPTKRPSSSSNSHGDGSGQPPGVDPLADQSSATRIDAQPWSSPIPSGFMGDFGQVYGLLDNNQTYGWIATNLRMLFQEALKLLSRSSTASFSSARNHPHHPRPGASGI